MCIASLCVRFESCTDERATRSHLDLNPVLTPRNQTKIFVVQEVKVELFDG